jgi:diamine N-acetyltransferase
MISIQPIDTSNYNEALKLEVHPEQQKYVYGVVESLARAYIQPLGQPIYPYGLYEQSKLIGFFYLTPLYEHPDAYKLNSFFLDRQFQGHGLGTPSILAIRDFCHETFPDCRELILSVDPHNPKAQKIYQNVGFVDNGQRDFDPDDGIEYIVMAYRY